MKHVTVLRGSSRTSPNHKHILMWVTFLLCLVLTIGILFTLTLDQFLFQATKFLSFQYLLALLLPDIFLLAALCKVASQLTIFSRQNRALIQTGVLNWKYFYYWLGISLCLIFVGGHLAYIPKPDVIILQVSIFALALLAIMIALCSNIDLSKAYLLVSTVIVTIVFLEITARVLLSATVFRAYSQLATAISDKKRPVDLDYGDVNSPPKDKLFREGGELLPKLNVRVIGESREEKVKFITNSKGFRNQNEFSYSPPPDTYRIIYIGDSFVAGYRVDQEVTSGKIMEDMLAELSRNSKPPRRIEVLAVTIGEPAAAWLWLEEYGFKYQPDLIVLGLTLGNDIFQTYIATDPEGYLEVTDKSIVHEGLPRIGFRIPPLNQLYLPPDAFTFDLKENSATSLFGQVIYRIKGKLSWTSLGTLIDYAGDNPVAIASWYEDTFPGQVYAFDPSNGLGLFYTPPLNQVENGFLRLEVVLQGLNDRAQEQQSDLVVVFFPQRFQVTKMDWVAAQQRYLLDASHFDLDYPNRRLTVICQQNNIVCFDLLDTFRNTTKLTTESLYLPLGDMHWNSKGQKMTGEAIGRFIWQEYLTFN